MRLMPTLTPSAPEATDTCCTPTSSAPMDEATSEHLAKIFKALGDPTRVKLLSLITASRDGEMCVCDLTEPVKLSQPTVSHHMKILVEAGLVTREQRGRWAYYQPTTNTLVAATQALATL